MKRWRDKLFAIGLSLFVLLGNMQPSTNLVFAQDQTTDVQSESEPVEEQGEPVEEEIIEEENEETEPEEEPEEQIVTMDVDDEDEEEEEESQLNFTSLQIVNRTNMYYDQSYYPSSVMAYLKENGKVVAKTKISYFDGGSFAWKKTDESVPTSGYHQVLSTSSYEVDFVSDSPYFYVHPDSDYNTAYIEIMREPQNVSVTFNLDNKSTNTNLGTVDVQLLYSNDGGSTWQPYWVESEQTKTVTLPSGKGTSTSVKASWSKLPARDLSNNDVIYKAEVQELPEGVVLQSQKDNSTTHTTSTGESYGYDSTSTINLLYWAGELDTDVTVQAQMFTVQVSIDGGEWQDANGVVIPADTDYAYKVSYIKGNSYSNREIKSSTVNFYVESGDWQGTFKNAYYVNSGLTISSKSSSALIFSIGRSGVFDTWDFAYGSGNSDFIVNMHSPKASEVQAGTNYSYLEVRDNFYYSGKYDDYEILIPVSLQLGFDGYATTKFPVEKAIDGQVPSDQNDTFTFVLEGQDDAPMPENDTITIQGAGQSSFDNIYYTEEGTYTYTVTEVADENLPYVYDRSEKTVTVDVTRDSNGLLQATYTVEGGSLTFTNTYKKTSLQVKKVDVTNQNELEGAHLQLLDEDGNILEEWDSTSESYLLSDLDIDTTYTLRETVAPDGYMIRSDVSFSIDKDGNVTTSASTTTDEDGNTVLLVEDEMTRLEVSKVDSESGELLKGAQLEVKDTDGNVIDQWTTDGTVHVIEGTLVAGQSYVLSETAAPNGYEVADDISFTVAEDGTIDPIVMKDVRTRVVPDDKEGTLTLTKKVMSSTGKSLNTDEVFYIGLFEDENFTTLSSMVAMDMNGTSEVTKTLNVSVPTTYYIAEVDANGHLVQDQTNFAYNVTIDHESVSFTDEQFEQSVTITNKVKPKKQTKSKNLTTSLFTNVQVWILLAIIALLGFRKASSH